MANYYYFVMAVAVMAALLACTCEADLISDVCVNVRNPTTCNRALRRNPHAIRADLRGLGEIIVPKSQAAIRVARMVAKAVESSENKAIIELCMEQHKEAMDMIRECKTLLRSPKIDKETLNVRASAAMTYVGDCDDAFEGIDMLPGDEPAVLYQASQNAQDMISVLLHISNML